jgi:enolase
MTNFLIKKSDATIESIKAYEVLDSRGFPTVAVNIWLSDGSMGSALVPSGASTGSFEAHELRDNDAQRYRGRGVLKAVENIETIVAPALIDRSVLPLASIDRVLLELDGTPQKENLGANAMLGVSLAAAQAGASSLGVPLFQLLGGINARRMPLPLVNVLNGGAHASNSLDFQEFMVVPHISSTFFENIRAAAEVFHALREILIARGLSVGLGDEGGVAPELKSSEEALDALLEAIDRAGYRAGEEISLALDVAANELYDKDSNSYVFSKGSMAGIESGDRLSSQQMISYYQDLLKRYPIVSIEDGLAEEDWDGWREMTAQLGSQVQLVGDDLFVTNRARLQRGIESQAGNAILVKLNQIGTVSETLEAIELAHSNAFATVISHRSGETEDTFIADLAVAAGSGQIKSGSVCRSERTAKYNRLLWIESFLEGEAYSINPFRAGFSSAP